MAKTSVRNIAVLVALATLAASALTAQTLQPRQPVNGRIGIFDLKDIDSVPLAPDVIKRTEQMMTAADGTKKMIVIEAIRITGRPGVRVFLYLVYPKNAQKLPVHLTVINEGVNTKPLIAEALAGRCGVMVCSTDAKTDPKQMLTLGGPPFKQFYPMDPQQSWFYHLVVALRRTITYVGTRPECDLSQMMVSGYSLSGQAVGLLHAIENRPKSFLIWHGTGFLVDKQGDESVVDYVGKANYAQYRLYSPAAYCEYGSSPIYVQSCANDYLSQFDALIYMYSHLRCVKFLAIAPNRAHSQTGRKELEGYNPWIFHTLYNTPPIPTVSDGKLSVVDGKLVYYFSFNSEEAPVYIDVNYSYKTLPRFEGCVWHRIPAVKQSDGSYQVNLPCYDPEMQLMVYGQVQTKNLGASANLPQIVKPSSLGITAAYSKYPNMLINAESGDDLFVNIAGSTEFTTPAPEGKRAYSITPFVDNTVQLFNFETQLWKGAKEIHLMLKGDGKPGPVNIFFAADREFWQSKPYTLVPKGSVFSSSWMDYRIPLSSIPDLETFRFLVFDFRERPGITLGLDAVRWQ